MAGLFAAGLLVLPTIRVMQGRLAPRQAVGLWVSGAGFLLLALAGLVLRPAEGRTAVLLGVTAAVVGNIIQRRNARTGDATRR
jgi:drug/metabolite transporter (DMT)-like permease